MSIRFKLVAALAAITLALSACGKAEEKEQTSKNQTEKKESGEKHESAEHEEVDYAAVFKENVTELEKAKENKDVDFDKVIKSYEEHLQSLVQQRDEEFDSTVDQHITTALQAGKEGKMDKVVVKQIFDKLMQKVFYTSMKHDFNEIAEYWGKTEEVKEEMEEAKGFYAILQSTVQKRDAAYGSSMENVIAGGFDEMDKAIEAKDELGFQLGKQLVDKTLMKTFYFATGALKDGYAAKAAEEAKKDETAAKVEQAEGWAFYQSLTSYMKEHASEEDAFISNQFDLQSDVTALDPASVNKAFVRGFAKIALDEYKESEETWGEDKAVITGLEGALFLDIIADDVKLLIGEEAQATLTEKGQKYIEAAKAKDQAAAEELLNELMSSTQTIIEKAK